jgi:xylan 1,4-beta-xylosidase
MRHEDAIELEVANLPFEINTLVVTHYRIDHSHSNAYAEWVRQGRPMYPTAEQRAAIEARAGLEQLEPPRTVTSHAGVVRLSFTMPVHSVSLLILAPAAA